MKTLHTLFAVAVLALVPALHAGEAPTDVAADASAGKTVTLSVTADGTQPFTYQWEKAPLGADTFSPVAGATAATLVLGGVSPADAGVYRVTVANAAGSITSPTATLRVLVGPTVESFTITVSGQ